MSVELTRDQQAVVDNEGGSLLVSAAAGSGKTRVLVDRLLRRVLGPERADVDDFLIITYTRAAAAELRERIARELKSGNIDADPWSRGEQDNACTYCEFASACHFMDDDGGDHVQMVRPVRPEEFWHHVNQTIGEEESL